MDFSKFIRDIPDFPKAGIIFKDITPLLQDKEAFRALIDEWVKINENKAIDLVVGPESRGFIFAPPLAYALNAGFIPVRKPGKLPFTTVKAEYALEYGTDAVHIHTDAIKKGQKILLVDDLLATGGTAAACCELIKELGGELVGIQFLVELTFLKGREKLEEIADVHTILKV
ncbi:adenine phosphoribosyltransferase [Candidatus Riflebacteria bacterium]